MKKFLILTLVLILSYVVKSQPGYTNISARYNWLAGVFRALHLPSGCGAPGFTAGQWHGDGAVYIDTCARKFYYYADGWIPLLDSSSINIGHVDSVYSTIDSLVVVKYTNGTRDTLNIAGGGTAANYYPVSFSFNTGTGVLTLNRNILSPITVSLNGRYLPFTDTASMLTPYLRKIDTSNKWVNKNLIHNDSIFYRIGVDTFGLKLPPPAPSGGYGIVSGGVITWLHDLVYNVSAATYWINGVLYSSPSTDVTLDPADGTFNRVDEIVGTTSGTVIVITGTPANPALEPDIDESTQFKFGFEIVFAGTTEPPISQIIRDTVYTSSTFKWTSPITSSSANLVVNSTNNPFGGSGEDIEGTNVANTNQVSLTRASAINLTAYNAFTFQIRNKGTWNTNRRLVFTFFNGITQVGSSVTFGPGLYGFNVANTTTYQPISISLADFGNPGTADRLLIRASMSSGTITGFYIDEIFLQGATTPTPQAQNFVSTIFRTPGIDSIYYKIAGVTYAIKDSTGASTPAGNYGNIQINRNGLFSTPASDSLTYSAGTLNIKGSEILTGQLTASETITVKGGGNDAAKLTTDNVSGNIGGDLNLRAATSGNYIDIEPTFGLAAYHNFKFGDNGNGSGTDTVATLEDVRTGGSTPTLNSITPADGTNLIDNAAYAQEWQWDSLTNGYGLKFTTTSSAAASNTQTVVVISATGANSTSGQTTYGLYAENLHGGTSAVGVAASFFASSGGNNTNVAIKAVASDALHNNYAIIVPDGGGRVGFGTSSPDESSILDLSSTTQGFLLPRMTKTQRDAIASPVAGLAIYQTDNTPGLRVYNGTNWMKYSETTD